MHTHTNTKQVELKQNDSSRLLNVNEYRIDLKCLRFHPSSAVETLINCFVVYYHRVVQYAKKVTHTFRMFGSH